MKRGFVLFFLIACFLQVTGQSTGKYQIKFLEVNKNNSDYAVAILDENKLVFTSADHKVTSAKKNYNPRKDLFVGDIDFDGEIKNVKRVTKEVNKNFNQTGVTYTKDGKTVYFSRNKYWKKLKKQNLPKNKRLTLYKADVEADGSWTNIEKLPFNKNKSTSGYPVLNADDSKLYFASDRLPSKGKTDVFVVDILDDGTYSKPRNLGSNVNTEGNETTPFITNENILYFSSDGHEGYGKLDVFAVEIYDDATSEVYRLASPINSINDDFAYIVNQDNNQGFFTSNRLQGAGFNDLYSFTLEEDVRPGECFISVNGRVIDKDSFESIGGATVDLYSLDGSLIESVSTYNDGTYKFTVSCANEYELVASNPDYLDDKKRIEILEKNYHTALHTNLNLTRIEKKQPPVERLSPIYYGFDDATITEEAAREMDKIVEVMNSNSNLIIEASSYTDSRGTDAYNIALSNRRAKAAVEYLKAQGIDASRIKSKGYGEEKLINQCVNGIECTDESHQMNRRTEFNFVNIPSTSKKTSSKPKKTKVAVQESKPVQKRSVKPVEKHVTAVESKAEVIAETPKISIEPKAEESIVAKAVVLEKGVAIENQKVESVKTAEVDHSIAAPVLMKKAEVKQPVVQVEKKEVEKKIIEQEPIVEEEPIVEKSLVAENRIENEKIEKEELAEASVQLNKSNNKETKEAVIINYNSSIVATNPESNKVLNYIGTEKTKMIDQLTELEKKYKEAIPQYPKLADSLSTYKEKIAEVIIKAKELEETGWSNIIEYKNNVLFFKKRYRDFMVMNSRGKVSGSTTRADRQVAHASSQTKEVRLEEQEIADLAIMEENLSVDNVQITAMKMSGNGKYQKTNNANKTDLIKVTFKLLSNDKVHSGQKEAHVVLQNPKGDVEEAKGIFKIKDSETETKYTDHAIINYNNHDMDVTMFIQRRGNNFEKGVYPIKVFLEGELMAVTKLDLQNSF
jgi:outer membrane protein OmpA-like peptidoglycan-associated protein